MKNNKPIIILLIIIALILLYMAFRPKAVVAPIEQGVENKIEEKKVSGVKEYKNDELGFSFSYPEKYGEIKQVPSLEGVPIVNKGKTGYIFRGHLLVYPDPFFYFTGMTTNYTSIGDRGFDCGESRSTYAELSRSYKESVNNNGERFLYYSSTIIGDYHPPHHAAFFETKKDYPLLGFCASIDVPEQEFLQVMDSVDIK